MSQLSELDIQNLRHLKKGLAVSYIKWYSTHS